MLGSAAFVAADLPSGGPVEAVESSQVMADKHLVDGRRWQLQTHAEAMRPDLVEASPADDTLLDRRRGAGRTATGSARTIDQAASAELLVAAPPLVGALAGDPHARSHMRDWLTSLDPPTQKQSTGRRQNGVTVTHEDLRVGELASTPAHLLPEVFAMVDPHPPVTNVHGNYN